MQNRQSMMYFWVIAVALLTFAAGLAVGTEVGRSSFVGIAARYAQITSGAFSECKDDTLPGVTNLNALEVMWEVRDKVKNEFVYPVSDDKELTYGAIKGMLNALDDPYTRFLDPEEYKDFRTDTSGHFDGIGAVLEARTDEESGKDRVMITSIIPEGPAAKTDLRPQDIIVRVDKTVVQGMSLNDVVTLIRGPRGTEVTLTVVREGVDDPLEITITRANVQVKVVEYSMLDDENKIGYLWLRQFNQNAVPEMTAALRDLTSKGMRGLVFDLSIDPGGILDVAVDVGSMFIPNGPIVFIKNRGEEPKPLNAVPGKAIDPNIKMVTLIDGGSASASEIVAGALQDTGRSVIVGSQSFGKSKVQTICELRDASAMFLSTAVYLTPKLRDIGEKDEEGNRGVKPDIEFPDPPTDAKITLKEWHDQRIEKAKQALLAEMKK